VKSGNETSRRWNARYGIYVIDADLPEPPTKKVRRARNEAFTMVPLQWAAEMTAATHSKKAMVGLWLLYKAWQTKSDTVTIANASLAGFGISRDLKLKALNQLEKAGLISIKRQPRRSPLVTLLRKPSKSA
jgi:hypothetical protein